MVKKIFVNLAVKNVEKSKVFFEQIGFQISSEFTDENAACVILGENMYAMLLSEDFFQTFTQKSLSNARKSTEVLVALEVESRDEVDALVEKAIHAGGEMYREPLDYGWMYNHSFADLDGHQWEVGFMDLSAIPRPEIVVKK